MQHLDRGSDAQFPFPIRVIPPKEVGSATPLHQHIPHDLPDHARGKQEGKAPLPTASPSDCLLDIPDLIPEKLRNKLDISMLAHIHSDFERGESELRIAGTNQTSLTAAEFLEHFVAQGANHQIEQVAREFRSAAENEEALAFFQGQCKGKFETDQKVLDSAQFLAKRWIAKVKALKPGERFILPAGWSDIQQKGFSKTIGGHAITYCIEKQKDGLYSLMVCNTGDGTQYHLHMTEGHKDRVSPVDLYTNLSEEEFLFPSFFTALIQLQSEAHFRVPSDWQGAEVLYQGLLSAFEKHRSRAPQDLVGFATAQRAGTCTWKSLKAALRVAVRDPITYKQLIHQLKFLSLIGGYQRAEERLAQDTAEAAQLRLVLRHAAQKCARRSLKQENHLTPRELRQVQATTAELLKRLDQIESQLTTERKAKRTPVEVRGAQQRFTREIGEKLVHPDYGFSREAPKGVPYPKTDVPTDMTQLSDYLTEIKKLVGPLRRAQLIQLMRTLPMPTGREG